MSYFIVHSGRRIDLSNISENDINLEDIAHHLTKICRYGGALELFQHYSVAQHSVLLCDYARDNGYSQYIQKALLMHDATETYLGDIVSGLKQLLPDYKGVESSLNTLICNKYKIANDLSTQEIVKKLDTRIVLDEAACLTPHLYNHFSEQLVSVERLGVTPRFEETLKGWYFTFLDRCNRLGIKD